MLSSNNTNCVRDHKNLIIWPIFLIIRWLFMILVIIQWFSWLFSDYSDNSVIIHDSSTQIMILHRTSGVPSKRHSIIKFQWLSWCKSEGPLRGHINVSFCPKTINNPWIYTRIIMNNLKVFLKGKCRRIFFCNFDFRSWF